jgi:hypothetical protein
MHRGDLPGLLHVPLAQGASQRPVVQPSRFDAERR